MTARDRDGAFPMRREGDTERFRQLKAGTPRHLDGDITTAELI
jgi:hypothetical protein